MDRLSRSLVATVAAALLLATVWLGMPNGSPPLYDGVCVANPYAYLNPPPDAPSQKPSSASHAVPAQPGGVPGSHVGTGEFPPQATMDTEDGSIVVAQGASPVTLGIDPVAAPARLPKDGRSDGNFYRFSATVGGKAASINPDKPVTISLRPTQVTGNAETVERLDGDHWTPLATSLGSCAIFMSANSTALGIFVLVVPGSTPGPQTSGGGGSAAAPASAGFNPLGVILATVVLAAIMLVLLRLSRARTGPDRRPGPRPRGRGR